MRLNMASERRGSSPPMDRRLTHLDAHRDKPGGSLSPRTPHVLG